MSDARFDLVITSGQCVLPATDDPNRLEIVQTSIGIRDGRIAALGDNLAPRAERTINAVGLHVLPGVIDTQVHFREPGLEHKEDLQTGTRAAVLGGVTAIFEMPNTKPPTTSRQTLEDKLTRAKGRCWSDYAFFIGATAANIDDLADLESLPGCCGVKVFMGSSTGSLLVSADEQIREVFAKGRRRVAVHAEDEDRLIERLPLLEGRDDPRLHPFWRDELVALRATQRVLRLAKETGRSVHVLHVTTAEEMELLRQNPGVVTVETCPQHLTLVAPDCYERLGTLAQMNPPIREARHREALWRAVLDGTVTVLGSDHAPHTREEKQKPYPQSPSGMPGVQTLLPLMLDHVNHGRLSLLRLVELTSRNPARIYGIRHKGEIKIGFDADLTLVDMSATREITNQWIASRCGWTPFAGMRVKGWPIATIVRGHEVMRDDTVLGAPEGKPVEFMS
jgi:dihydroorotase